MPVKEDCPLLPSSSMSDSAWSRAIIRWRETSVLVASWFKDEDDADYEDPILASLLEMATHHGVPMEGGILTPFKTSRA